MPHLSHVQVESVAADGPWLLQTLQSVLPHDDFTRQLVEIYKEVHAEGQPLQRVHLGIHRSDYMLNGQVRAGACDEVAAIRGAACGPRGRVTSCGAHPPYHAP
jgi:hypothetical protein